MQEMISGVHHRFCVLHLWKNFTERWKDKEMKNLVWEYAKSTIVNQFNVNMERLKRLNDKARAYLDKWPKDAWTKAYFSEALKWTTFATMLVRCLIPRLLSIGQSRY